VSERLRLAALDALGPHGDELAREALEAGELSLEEAVSTWEASSGTVRGRRVALALPDALLARVRASFAAIDAMHAAVAAAIARDSERDALLDLRLCERASKPGSPYRERLVFFGAMNAPSGTSYFHDLDAAWQTSGHGPRLRAVRVAGEQLRDRFARGPRVVAVRTLPLTTLPYPTRYAFNGAATSPAPFVSMTHRCVLVQFMQGGALKSLLFNPTDIDAARTGTPFFAQLDAMAPKFLEPMLMKRYEPLEAQLAAFGLSPSDIDYVAFDHFHTQDLRALLGTEDGARPARFPNAVLLAPDAEWTDWDDLHPMQRAWFVRDGKRGVHMARVARTAGDLAIGDGVMLVRTPGHTSGNQTLFMNTASGVWGISENGTCADNWSPLESKIAGLASYCRRFEVDVVINSNTPELGAQQYTSMILERTIVDRAARASAFVQMFSSSEVTPSWTAPALAPTILHREIREGEVSKKAAAKQPPRRAENGRAIGAR
jgi:glyoxylase-like metal-dependent hydrolase (beta-lactamase superfamily II)